MFTSNSSKPHLHTKKKKVRPLHEFTRYIVSCIQSDHQQEGARLIWVHFNRVLWEALGGKWCLTLPLLRIRHMWVSHGALLSLFSKCSSPYMQMKVMYLMLYDRGSKLGSAEPRGYARCCSGFPEGPNWPHVPETSQDWFFCDEKKMFVKPKVGWA